MQWNNDNDDCNADNEENDIHRPNQRTRENW